ncbi:MAG: trigger factor [Actinomycetes bacterium]|jgi:trigger factor|nr:MAG: trigger factor [Actinomycetota bacterium]
MTHTITETGPFERLVKFRISEEAINEAKKVAARRLSEGIKIRGFRPGKAPLPIVEATVGADRVRKEAIDEALPKVLEEILEEQDLQPAVRPRLESLNEEEGAVEAEVRITLWPTIETPNYKDRKIVVTNPEVTDEELEENIKRMLEQFGTVEEVDRPAGEGDFVSIDITATKDGEEVEGATVSDLLYEVGSGGFLEGADEHLTGKKARDVVEFNGPLPSGFGERAGEEVLFKITLNEVKERVLPELDDEWVDENTEFETVEELREALREQLRDVKVRAAAREFSEKALSTLRDEVDIEIPDGLIEAEANDIIHNFLHRLEDAELSLEDYFRATGTNSDVLVADAKEQAKVSILNRLVLESIVEAEGITVTEEELSNAVQALAARSGDPVRFIKAFRQAGQELALAGDILRNRALDVILSNASPVDEDGNPLDLTIQGQDVVGEVVSDEVVEGEVVALEEEE